MGLIYKVTSPSGKYYIGRTIYTLEKRWSEHILEANKKSKRGSWLLNNAIKKYGGDNFQLEIIEDNINDIKILMEKEEYWIKYYDATNIGKGYNRSPGKGGHIAQSIQQYDLNGNFIKEWINIGDILNYYNWDERNLYECLSGGYSHFHGFLWKYSNDTKNILELVEKYKMNHGKLGGGYTIKCIETNEIFSSMRALERHLNVSHGTINGRFKRYGEMIEYKNLHYIKEK